MQNPAYAMDSRFKLLAIDSDEDLIYSSLTLKRLKEHGYMPIQTVVKILNSRTWTQVHATAEPVLMKMDEFYCPFINCAIQFQGQFQGYLIVVGLAHDLNQGDLDLVKQIMPIIDRIAMSDIEVSTGRGSYYEHFLLDMIRGNLRDRVLIAEQMTPLGWSLRDRYVAMAARLVPQRNDLNDTFFLRISQLFEGKPVITEDRLFCVFRLKKEQDYEQLVREMRKLCDLCKFKVGLSGVFADFTELSAQAGLAGRTLDMGLTRSPGSFVYLASDYRLFCLFDIGRTQMDLREFIPPELQLLEQHDLENNTEYVHTLYVYLTHERNWVTTSEALHIHRNSLRYRIERLENMTGLSLDDADTRLRLLLAYEIKKYFDKLG